MVDYINPVYTDFRYQDQGTRKSVEEIISRLIDINGGLKPEIKTGKQSERSHWGKKRGEAPRIIVSWKLDRIGEVMHKRLEEIFQESICNGEQCITRANYRSKGYGPAKFVGLDGNVNGRIRGFPLYEEAEYHTGIRDTVGLSRADNIMWAVRQFANIKDVREKMRGRGNNYWFETDGKFKIELKLSACKEIEFIDTILRTSVILGGTEEKFDRNKALVLSQKELVKRKRKEIHQADLIGLDSIIEAVKFRQFFATVNPEEAGKLGITNESVLLVGVPGVGKTSIASSLLWDANLDKTIFIPINVTELLEGSYTVEKYIETFFGGIDDLHTRYGFEPILWCDDLESAFLEEGHADARMVASNQSTLLNHLQGVSKNSNVRISGSTNRPEKIDPRFLEFGRISYLFHIPIPQNPDVLAEVLTTHIDLRGQEIDDSINIGEIASKSLGFTPRMMVNLVNEAGIQAAQRVYGKFSDTLPKSAKPLKVTAKDYEKAGDFLRERSDLRQLRKRDEEIGEFVAKHNKGRMGLI